MSFKKKELELPIPPEEENPFGEEMMERHYDTPYSQINSDFYRLKLETEPTLKRMYENWLRVQWDSEANNGEGALVRIEGQEPMINEKGAMDIMTVLIDVINKENIQGNLDDNYIRSMTIEHACNISSLIFSHHKEY